MPPSYAYPHLRTPPALPAEAGLAACVDERGPFDELDSRAGAPTARYVDAAAAVCNRCPVANACPARVRSRPSPAHVGPHRLRSSKAARQAVIAHLSEHDEVTAKQISEAIGLPLANVRVAVLDLCHQGRLNKRRAQAGEGGRVYLSLASPRKA
ncbi:hypothetical protein ACWD4N_44855 [Streptomyces sp. NPDC002586]